MSIIQFENGMKVNFEGNPTPSDIEYVAEQIGIKTAQPSQPSFMQEEKAAINRALQPASGISDLFSGGGAVANAAVNIPFKYATQAVANLPGVKQALTPFSVGMERLQNSDINQSITQPVKGLLSDLQQNYPKQSEALGGLGNMVKAGLTVSSVGQGLNSLKNVVHNKLVVPQQVGGVQKTLSSGLGVNPEEARSVTSVIDDIGATSHIAQGNYDAAKWMVKNAMDNAVRTVEAGQQTPGLIAHISDLEKASQFIDGLKTVPFQPTTLSNVATGAGTLAKGAAGLLGHAGMSALKGAGLASGAGLVGYPLARYWGLTK